MPWFCKNNKTLHLRLLSAVTHTEQKALDGEGGWAIGIVEEKKQRADCVLLCLDLQGYSATQGGQRWLRWGQDLIPKQWPPGVPGNREAKTHFIVSPLLQIHPVLWIPVVPLFSFFFLFLYGKPQIYQYQLECMHCSFSRVQPGQHPLHLILLLIFLNHFCFLFSLSFFLFVQCYYLVSPWL